MFETFVREWALRGAVALDAVAVAVVLVAGLWAFGSVVVALARRAPSGPVGPARGRLARWLAFALELLIGSDIIRTAISPSWLELGQLAAIIVMRLALEFTLLRETQ